MSESQAKAFLKGIYTCSYMQTVAEENREEEFSSIWGETVDVYEECCDEGCNHEEMEENFGTETLSVRTSTYRICYTVNKIT